MDKVRVMAMVWVNAKVSVTSSTRFMSWPRCWPRQRPFSLVLLRFTSLYPLSERSALLPCMLAADYVSSNAADKTTYGLSMLLSTLSSSSCTPHGPIRARCPIHSQTPNVSVPKQPTRTENDAMHTKKKGVSLRESRGTKQQAAGSI